MSEESLRERPAWLPLVEQVEAAVARALEEVRLRLPTAAPPEESLRELEQAFQVAGQHCQALLALSDQAEQRVAGVAQELEKVEEALRRWLHASQTCRETLAAGTGRVS
jgi:hypothetical protein